METKWKELLPYKDQPVFIYCSHSQRSRIFSKFLSDSGFTKIINVNGAMTEFNLLKFKEPECTTELYETNNKFGLLSPQDVAKLMSTVTNLFILDVRADSAFRGISSDPMANAHGRLKGAVNIPFSDLPSNLGKVPKNRPVLVVADFGRETNLASKLLSENGYTQVYAAFNGMNQWMSTSAKELPSRDKLWVRKIPYKTITAEEMDKKLSSSPNIFILDIRTVEEFTNQVKKIPGEIGAISGKLSTSLFLIWTERWNEIAGMKNKNIILYSFGTNPEAFQAASLLASKGFTKVEVLTGGLWDVRWKGANLKGQSN
jgi:rhodanese-related sulfurtransferase